MIRGIERRIIFRNKTDRFDFLERLEKLIPEAGKRRKNCFTKTLLLDAGLSGKDAYFANGLG